MGAFGVFYGPNGAGKSNLLDVVKKLCALLRAHAKSGCALSLQDKAHVCAEWGKAFVESGLLDVTDISRRDASRALALGARFVANSGASLGGGLALGDLVIEVSVGWSLEDSPTVQLSRVESAGVDLRDTWPLDDAGHQKRRELQVFLTKDLPASAYHVVGANRNPRPEQRAVPDENARRSRGDVSWHLRNGRLKTALLSARISPDPQTRRRLDDLRRLLAGPPLGRPPFEPVQDPETGAIELQERLPDPNPEGLEIPIHLAGLGVVQIYSILAQAMLSGARIIAIEEPEAHLHAPTSGRALRHLLKRLVEEGFVDQLLIATPRTCSTWTPRGISTSRSPRVAPAFSATT